MNLHHCILKCLLRHSFVRNKKLILTSLSVNQRRLCSSSSDSSDEENGTPKSKKEIYKEKARTEMKDLLSSLIQTKMGEDFVSPSTLKAFEKYVDVKEKEMKIPSTESDENIELQEETKNQMMNLLSTFNKTKMGEDFGSPSTLKTFEKDVKEKEIKIPSTESDENIELQEETKNQMMNLLSTFNKKTYSEDEAIKITQAQPRKEEADVEFIDFSVKKAVKDVAELLGGDKTKKAETESELLQSLRSVTTSKLDLSGTISEMRISDSNDFEMKTGMESKIPESRLHEFRRMALPQPSMRMGLEKIDVLGAKPLNIFPKDFKPEGKESVLDFWDNLNEREIKFSISQHPRNYFEEMINWTEEGKVWTFPIDNEIGLEEEKSHSFADHIFLENHLSEWCPKKGPIRHFMELVCVGLSKNPFLTVKRKKAHIEWYKDYFDSKKDLLQEIGAI